MNTDKLNLVSKINCKITFDELNIGEKYFVKSFKIVSSAYGEAVIATIQTGDDIYKDLFLPNRLRNIFSEGYCQRYLEAPHFYIIYNGKKNGYNDFQFYEEK